MYRFCLPLWRRNTFALDGSSETAGKRPRDLRLEQGDRLQLYINDEFFDTPRADNGYLTVTAPKLQIVHEDENILLVDKRPGLAVHPHDGAEYGKTLIDHIQAYLYAKHEWNPRAEHSFAPALCNRIDRQYRRYCDCRQKCRGASDYESEDQGP